MQKAPPTPAQPSPALGRGPGRAAGAVARSSGCTLQPSASRAGCRPEAQMPPVDGGSRGEAGQAGGNLDQVPCPRTAGSSTPGRLRSMPAHPTAHPLLPTHLAVPPAPQQGAVQQHRAFHARARANVFRRPSNEGAQSALAAACMGVGWGVAESGQHVGSRSSCRVPAPVCDARASESRQPGRRPGHPLSAAAALPASARPGVAHQKGPARPPALPASPRRSRPAALP